MFTCPKCGMKLLDNTGSCQFCKSTWDVPKAPRQSRLQADPPALGAVQPWIWKAYYGIAIWWIFNGVLEILLSVINAAKVGSGSLVGIVAGAITLVVGIGLVAKVPIVRKIVNFVCFMNIAFGLMGLLASFFLLAGSGIWGILSVIWQFLRIGLAGLLIYIIAETDQDPGF